MSAPQTQKYAVEGKAPPRPLDDFSDAPPQWRKLEEILAMRSSAGEPMPSGLRRSPAAVSAPCYSSVPARQPAPAKAASAGVYAAKPFSGAAPAAALDPRTISVVGSGVGQAPGGQRQSAPGQQTHSFASPPQPAPGGYCSTARPAGPAQRLPLPQPQPQPQPQLPQPQLPQPQTYPQLPQLPHQPQKRSQRTSSTQLIESISQLVSQSQHRQSQEHTPARSGAGNGVSGISGKCDVSVETNGPGGGGGRNAPPGWSGRDAERQKPRSSGADRPKNLTPGDRDDLRRLHELMEITRAESEICQMEMVMQNQEAEATEQRRLARERAFREAERSTADDPRGGGGGTEPELAADDDPGSALDRLRRGNKYWSTGLVAGGPSDRELVSLLLTRLTQLESQLARARQALAERDRLVEELRGAAEVGPAGARGRRTRPADGDRDDLQRECRRLQKHVRDMEKFLADYGLEWVGSGASSDDLTTARSHADADAVDGDGDKARLPPASQRDAFAVNFDLLAARVAELNVLAGADQPQLCRTPRGARFMPVPPLPLAVYSNGLVLEAGPFRPYSDPLVQLFVMDLQDGYFPTELKERFPDGVPLRLLDRRHEEYRPPAPARAFSGPGYRLGGRRRSSRLVAEYYGRRQREREKHEQRRHRAGSAEPAAGGAGAGKTAARRTPSSSGYLSAGSSGCDRSTSPLPPRCPAADRPPPPPASPPRQAASSAALGSAGGGRPPPPSPAVSRFLARLPKTVVRNGRLIEIRRSVEELLSGRASPPAEPPPPPPPSPPAPPPPARPPQPTTVRVRTPQDACLTLELDSCSTVAELRRRIDASGRAPAEPYGLMTAYPRRMLWDGQLTLHECGLSPNGVVIMTRQRSM